MAETVLYKGKFYVTTDPEIPEEAKQKLGIKSAKVAKTKKQLDKTEKELKKLEE